MTIYTNVDSAPTQRAAAHALRDAAPWLTKADHKRRRKALIRALVRVHPQWLIARGYPTRTLKLYRVIERIDRRLRAHAWAAQYLCRKRAS